jgi:multidrug efflux pump
MQLAEISIRRPVFATVLSLLILLVGLCQLHPPDGARIPQDRRAVVTVSVRYAGASAEVIESQVTKPLEDSIAGIDAVDVITSISRPEQAQISVRFRLEKDADAAAAEVRDKHRARAQPLPQGIDEPVIAKVEADAFPVMFLAFSRTRVAAADQRHGQPHCQAAPADGARRGRRAHLRRAQVRHAGVAGPGPAGRLPLTTQDVEDAIRRSNLELPAGRIESAQREFNVTSQTDLLRPAQFRQIVIRNRQRLSGAHARRGAGGGGRRRRAQRRAPERARRHLGRRDPPGHGQPAGAVARRARDDPASCRRPAGRRA